MFEQWEDVSNVFGDRYEVSSYGRVRNKKTGYVLTPMRTGTKRPGSQRSKVRLSTRPRADYDVAHLVLEAFVGARFPGEVAMHLDDDSANNRLDNLRWGSPSENVRACVDQCRPPNQRVTREQAAEIIARRRSGETGASLAREFGISQQRVCDIYKGRTIFADSQPAK